MILFLGKSVVLCTKYVIESIGLLTIIRIVSGECFIKILADALPVGPILIGPTRPAHILTPSVTARGILNMTAVAAVEAQERAGRQQPTLFG